jgi:hypothetical protein
MVKPWFRSAAEKTTKVRYRSFHPAAWITNAQPWGSFNSEDDRDAGAGVEDLHIKPSFAAGVFDKKSVTGAMAGSS